MPIWRERGRKCDLTRGSSKEDWLRLSVRSRGMDGGGGVLSKAAEAAVLPSSKPRPTTNARLTTTLLTEAGRPTNLSADLLPPIEKP
jgi:hypothetical protein